MNPELELLQVEHASGGRLCESPFLTCPSVLQPTPFGDDARGEGADSSRARRDGDNESQSIQVRVNPVAGRVLDLEELWPRLKTGNVKIKATLFSATHTSFLLIPCKNGGSAGGERRPLPERYAEILERTLLDAGPKVVAAEFGYSISGIGTILKQCLEFFGLRCKPCQVPALLVMALTAARQKPRSRKRDAASDVELTARLAEGYSVVSAPRPEAVLHGILSPAQVSVTGLLVEGKTYSEMAQLRSTSVRTVANQIASAFKRLGVSGRAELLRYLLSVEAEPRYSRRMPTADGRLTECPMAECRMAEC